MSALWGLSRGERTAGPASEGEAALHATLLSQLETAVAASDDDPEMPTSSGNDSSPGSLGSKR